MWKRRKRNEGMEGSQALEEARKNLRQAKEEREEVDHLSSFLRSHRMENHISQRIDLMLRSRK